MEKFIKLFWIIFIIPLFIANTTCSQNTLKGSWIISSRYEYFEIFDHRTYQLDFSSLGDVQLTSVGSGVIDGNYDSPLYSLGAFDASGDLDFYILGEYYQYDGNITTWGHGQSNFGGKNPDIQIIRNLDEQDKYLLFYSYNSLSKDPYETKFTVVDITVSDDEVEFVERDVDYLVPPNSYDFDETDVAFIISNYNLEDNSRYLFASTTAPLNDPDDYFGLMKLEIDDNNDIEIVDYLLASNDSEVFSSSDFGAYNLEMQNKNEVEDPIIAWIKKPIPGENSKIFIYLPDDEEYFIEMNEGAIGGIEFSPFDGEENIMYVSTENSGLVKLDYINQEYTVLSGENEFKNTYVQTAPDGNVYAVSVDGTHLGRVDKEDGLLHHHIIDYEDTYIHGTFYEIEDIRYFTLPENDQPVMKVEVQTSYILCDQNTAIASIYVQGGIPPYGIEVKRGTTNVSEYFTWDDECGCFRGTQLIAGTYKYTITDSGTTGELGITGEFDIVEGDAYDFEDNLLEINNQTATSINGLSDLVWDENDVSPQKGFLLNNTILFKHGFRLDSNTVLTINNLRLEFDEDYFAKVIIEPGSKLVLNNCTLTNYHCSDDPKKWAGIEVVGIPGKSQRINEDGNYDQGYLVLNNSTIEHAITAVNLRKADDNWAEHGGGIVKAYNSSFINNAKSVWFAPYRNMIELGDDPKFEGNNETVFKNCLFEIDENYLNDAVFYKHADVVRVKGVQFLASNFKRSSNENTSSYCTAIEGYSAGISVKSFNEVPSTFEGFYTGIVLTYNSSGTYTSYIRNSEFTNNSIGIKLNPNTNVVSIEDNIFNVGYNSPDKGVCGVSQGFGIFLNNSNTFIIQDNEFYKYSQAPEDGDYIGIEAFNTQTSTDEIFSNTFEGLTHASHATGENWDVVENNRFKGLAFYCNENSNNNNDLFFIYDDLLNKPNSGVQIGQGDSSRSAGNVFTQNISGYHIYNNTGHGVGYYYDLNEISETPIVYNSGSAQVTIHGQNLAANCSGGINPKELTEQEKSAIETDYLANESSYESIKSLYESLEDGGNTEELQTEVISSWPNEMWELRAELLGLSPYLSTKVLLTAADKTDVLPESVLFEILSANPEELKKEELMSYLENKEEPLPDYMIDILHQLASGQSAKTILQNQLAQYHRAKSRSAMEMLVCLPYDEVFDYSSYRLWLSRLGGINNDRRIVASFIEEENYTDALSLANMLPELYELEEQALIEHEFYIDLLEFDINLKQTNRSPLEITEEEFALIEYIAQNSTSAPGVNAKAILEYFYDQHFCNCVNTSVDVNKSANASIDPNQFAEAMGLFITADPNPASTWVTFNYQIPVGKDKAVLTIKNTEAKQIAQFIFTSEVGQKVWDTRSINAGTYIYEFSCDKLNQSGKIVIIK